MRKYVEMRLAQRGGYCARFAADHVAQGSNWGSTAQILTIMQLANSSVGTGEARNVTSMLG